MDFKYKVTIYGDEAIMLLAAAVSAWRGYWLDAALLMATFCVLRVCRK